MSNHNILWGCILAEELYLAGVRLVCISPGSRSTPIVWGLVKLRQVKPDLQLIVHLDERNSAFFALGHSKRSKTLVALVCTSGTAPAHYFPAIIEANLSLVPLIILSADRPSFLRDCGAPQTIDQIKLFGSQVRYFYDGGLPNISPQSINGFRNSLRRSIGIARGDLGAPMGPVHLNFPFTEPLIDDPNLIYPFCTQPREELTSYTNRNLEWNLEFLNRIAHKIEQCPRGIIIVGVGSFPEEFAQILQRFSTQVGYPVFVESIGLIRHQFISHYDSFLRSEQFSKEHSPQLVMRFGAMPTSKYLSKWLAQHLESWSELVIGETFNNPLNGNSHFLSSAPIYFLQELESQILTRPQEQKCAWVSAFENAEIKTTQVVSSFLNRVPFWFEGTVYHELSQNLPNNTCLYVANSMPTRDLDTFFRSKNRIKVLANKGANGIDGTISSALGAALNAEYSTVLICGDIAFYHDINTLLTASKYKINLTIILLNNDGGAIFNYLDISGYNPPFQEFFITPHGLDFAQIVPAFACEYQLITSYQQLIQEIRLIPDRNQNQTGTKVLEIKIDRAQSWHLHQELWQKVIEVI